MINTSLPSNLANLVAPFNPVGQRPVGQEGADGRISSFKPVEQPAESARTQSRAQQNGFVGNVNAGQSGAVESENTATDDAAATEVQRQLSAAEKRRLDQEQQEIAKLAARDREVRAHEQAHAAIGGQYAGAAQYQFERGPDGVRYAVGGEVPIDVGREATPEATIAKMQVVKRAALAPAEPSPQDRRVAAQATRIEAQARQEVRSVDESDAPEETEAAEPTGDVDAAPRGPQLPNDVPTGASRENNPVTPSLPLSGNTLSSRLSAGISNASLETRQPGNILDQLA